MPLAQLDRALGCGPKGRRFESSRAYIWRDARVVESGGFEIRCAGFRYPGFESLSLRRKDIGFDRISGMLKNVQGFETSERGRRPNSRQDVGDSERGGLEKRDTMSSFGRRIPVSPLVNWSGDREAEGVRLESVCTLTGYRGFESLPLRLFPRVDPRVPC